MELKFTNNLILPKTGNFRYWKYANNVTTYIQNNICFKSLDNWDGDIEWANSAVELWHKLEFKGNPSCPASFFHELYRGPKINWSINSTLSAYFHGAVQQVFELGLIQPPLYYYDMKSAYLWGGLKGLPLNFRYYAYGDKNFIAIVELLKIPDNAPNCFRRKIQVVTNEDIEYYNLEVKILWAVSCFNFDYPIAPIMERLNNVLDERTMKRITQSYWGRWAAKAPFFMVNVKEGKAKYTQLKSIFANFIWAIIIIHRVIRRVWEVKQLDTVLILTDAVLKKSRLLSVGNLPGMFRLKDSFDKPVYVRSPGLWSIAPVPNDRAYWLKHSGYAREIREQSILNDFNNAEISLNS